MNKRNTNNRHKRVKDTTLPDYWQIFTHTQRNLYIEQLKKWKFYFKD
jgi:hypothetical protein